MFPSDEHLRKRALVKAGWADHSQTIFDTPADAKKHAVDIRKIDTYAVIKVSGCVVDVWIARSIGAGQIRGDEFKAVKERVLAWLASLSGLTLAELEAASSMS